MSISVATDEIRSVVRKLHVNTAMCRNWVGSTSIATLCRAVLFTAAVFVAAAKEPPPKELVTYVENARRLGVSDEQIRRNAANAGWAPALVDDAFAAVAIGPEAQPAAAAAAALPTPENYVIGPGDVLQISVWKEPEASVPAAAVRADGKISLPLIKEVEVAGLTPRQAEQMLAERLRRYILSADVTVIVTQVNSRKAYLVGAVRTVGAIDLRGATTVLQAITQAGGLTDYAKRKNIYVLRTENGRQMKLPFNYEAVVKGERMEQNILLMPNDTVVVPQ